MVSVSWEENDRGSRNDPGTEYLAVSANTVLLRDSGLRHIALLMLPLNDASEPYGPISGTLHSLGKVRALTSRRQLGYTSGGSCKLKI